MMTESTYEPRYNDYSTPACSWCGKRSLISLDIQKVYRWLNGELIQNVWPEMDADQRELLITGTHADCWEEMAAGEEADGRL